MNVRRLFLTLTCMLIGITSVHADQSCWQTIKTYLATVKTEEQRQLADRYVASLTPNQLILAGRECSREIECQVDPKDWDMAVLPLGFFYQYYPKKTHLQDLTPVLEEIANKDVSPLWRRFLLRLLLSDWDGSLAQSRQVEIVKHLMPVLTDTADSIRVRETLPIEIVYALTRNAPTANGDSTGQAKRKEFVAISEIYITNALSLFIRSDTPLPIRESLINSLVLSCERGMPGSDRVKDSVSHAIQNYKNYPEELWDPLLKAAKWLKVENIEAVAREMERKKRPPE